MPNTRGRVVFAGTGPGAQTEDGCSVELYRLLPYFGELDAVRPFLPHGASILELGAGAGRLTRVLLAWGLKPTAVDFSEEMLAFVPDGVERVCSSIEELRLGRRFDIVLLASCLINHPDEATRRAYVAGAARHLRPNGHFILERHDPDWLATAAVGSVAGAGPVGIRVENVERGRGLVAMRLRYELEGLSWSHDFAACSLSERDIEGQLAGHGFTAVSWHGAKCRWAVASRAARDAT